MRNNSLMNSWPFWLLFFVYLPSLIPRLILAFSSTLLTWIDCRQLLYLDFFRFFGTMLIVLKEMLKESAVFFLLLLVIVAGFLQSFFGYVWHLTPHLIPIRPNPTPPITRVPLLPLVVLLTYVRLDSTDGNITVMRKVLHTMTQALLQAPDFDFYNDISPPFGLLLFYLFNFIVSICTLPSPPFPLLLVWVGVDINSTPEYSRRTIQSSIFRGNG
jgi:hypothetical protein